MDRIRTRRAFHRTETGALAHDKVISRNISRCRDLSTCKMKNFYICFTVSMPKNSMRK